MTRRDLWLGRVVLAFWAGWFAIVAASNACDLAKTLVGLPDDWKFASGNLALLIQTTDIYHVPAWANELLLAAIVAWELLVAGLMARALAESARQEVSAARIDRAFAAAVGLFAAFCLADELFVAFPTGIEATHLQIVLVLLVSFVSCQWSVVRSQ